MKAKKLIFFLAVLLCVACITAGGVLCFSMWQAKNNAKSLNSEAVRSISQMSESGARKNPIDFAALQKKNKDAYAWIRISDTQIDYPILQSYSESDSFYLDHNIKKNYDINGSIYTEKLNKTDFSDPNTVIYGHNMLDGSMFQNLHKFRDKTFFDKHKYIYIYTPGHILKYEIFAAYKSDNKHILNSYDFSNTDVFADYLKNAQNPNSLEVNTRKLNLTTNDKIITLSTCIGNETNYRYLVQGVLKNDTITE